MAAGTLATTAGILATTAGILATTAGTLATTAGILATTAGTLAMAAGILATTAGTLAMAKKAISRLHQTSIVYRRKIFLSSGGGARGMKMRKTSHEATKPRRKKGGKEYLPY
jgi:hypothetical protein